MMMRCKRKLTFLLLLFCTLVYGQVADYSYRRALTGVMNQWHSIVLPNEIFGKLDQNLSDIRIFGVLEDKDTLEVPYILRLVTEKLSSKEQSFHLINQSKNEKGYYYTYELGQNSSVNEILLDFKQENFDWKVNVEGSQNQQDWFSIIDNYRILSINNSQTNYKFTTITFPDAKFRYIRVQIISQKQPELLSTKVILTENVVSKYRNYKINCTKVREDKKYKQTILDIRLAEAVPVSYLKIDVKNKYDYYRPITIEYLSDSTKTPTGWIPVYNRLLEGTLNSLEKNEFKFNSMTLKEIKVIIDNQDNAALRIQSVSVKGYDHQLIARFDTPATYYLAYGNKNAVKPDYDIERFVDSIPTSLTPLMLGHEQIIKRESAKPDKPLFENKMWLWAIMGIIIILLAWFTLKMITKK
jgi:hypothetical protein